MIDGDTSTDGNSTSTINGDTLRVKGGHLFAVHASHV
jgi:hypothetical protein